MSDGYLTAMGVPLLDGRELETADGATAPPVIVMNRSAARRYFGTGSPVGQLVDWHVGKGQRSNESGRRRRGPASGITDRRSWFRRSSSTTGSSCNLQVGWGASAQRQNEGAIGFLSFALRTSGDPASAVPQVRQIVSAVDPNIGIDAILPMIRLEGSSLARERFYAVMLGAFAGVAGVLAAIGIYGVLAYAVMQRTQEIGIRMALGAQRAQVLALVLRKGVILTTIGVALGLVGAAAGTRFLQGMLFGITPLDPTTFLAVSLMFGLVATLASYVPARRATKVDPIVALRSE